MYVKGIPYSPVPKVVQSPHVVFRSLVCRFEGRRLNSLDAVSETNDIVDAVGTKLYAALVFNGRVKLRSVRSAQLQGCL